MKIQQLLEAIPLAQAKKYRSEWNPNTYNDLFKSLPYQHDKNYYRVYIPFSSQKTTSASLKVPQSVDQAVKAKGYEIFVS